METFKLLSGFKESRHSLTDYIEVIVNDDFSKVMQFKLEGGEVVRECDIPSNVPMRIVLDLLVEYYYEPANEETYDHIIEHLKLLLENFVN